VQVGAVKTKTIPDELVARCRARFWSKVRVGREDECWPYLAAKKDNGYGYFGLSRDAGMIGAHRFAWISTYGEAGGLYVCHRCDNRPCCNPRHLWLGTAKENQQDMASKGRVYSYVKDNPDIRRTANGRFIKGD
jgi:hypothetical protein